MSPLPDMNERFDASDDANRAAEVAEAPYNIPDAQTLFARELTNPKVFAEEQEKADRALAIGLINKETHDAAMSAIEKAKEKVANEPQHARNHNYGHFGH